ncbi:GNAT family N-acetyltransferase [Enterococcus sp. CSURQ0835]|uniref:GNAT family N-acetyltransferase n=1 Tax=Enterococcus sp. CSURQ0835 TaxID=2681394 RepID=UPI00135A2E14|nr:GNAT family N-acetyltransferase [Enterococcus sp. CSURQ0835]
MIKLKTTEAIPWELLLLADPERKKVAAYLPTSQLLLFEKSGQTVGVLVYQERETEIELMNLAVAPAFQRQGIASQLIDHFLQLCRNCSQTLVVKTGEIPPGPLALYQQKGFVVCERVKNYFVEQYTEPIMEDGQRLRDQLILKRAASK